jgi:hypothetical protein
MGPISFFFLVLPEYISFGLFLCNRRFAIALEVAQPLSALRESRQAQSYFDAHPHLEAVPIFQRIVLEGWGWAQSLCLF